jgi:PAS domain S-box-containing protein
MSEPTALPSTESSSEKLETPITGTWLEVVLGQSEEGVVVTDLEGTILYVNPAQAGQLGYTREELTGRPWQVFFPTQEAESSRLCEEIMAATRRGDGWHGRLKQRTKDGSIVDVDLRMFLLRGPDGQPQSMIGFRRDLSSPSNMALEARRLLFEQSAWLTTLNRLVADSLEGPSVPATAARLAQAMQSDLGASQVAVAMLDPLEQTITIEAAVGLDPQDLPSGPRPVAHFPNVAEALDAGHPIPASNRGPGLASFATLPLYVGDQPLGAVLINTAPDLDRLQIYAPHLATALYNAVLVDRLRAANEHLREIDRQKNDFLNMVAHDLRTPLTCIRTYADLIQMYVDQPPEVYREFLRIIAEESDRLAALITNFLDLARIEAGTLAYEYEPCFLPDLVERLLELHRASAEARQITLSFHFDPDLPQVLADRGRIEQVLSNLLGNAFKFTPDGGRVTVTVEREPAESPPPSNGGPEAPAPPPSPGVRVTVTDTGPGVPETDRQRIFEKFQQGRERPHRPRSGTGLGLAIAREIVTHHGGRLWVEAGPEGGAQFVFTLPLRPPEGRGSPGAS